MSQCGVGNPHKGLSAMCQYAETTQGVWVLDADIRYYSVSVARIGRFYGLDH